MSYEFECRHVVPGCDGRVSGDTRDEVMRAAAAHASEVHGMTDVPDEVAETIRSSIVETD